MSKHSGFRSALVLLAAVLMAVLAHPLAGAEPSTEAARLETFTHADGSTYFALSLSAGPVELAKASDVVVLFDTSASQAGQYRADALASLKSLLAGLKAEDRVQLIAVDVNTVPMTEGFVKPAGEEIAAALQKLECSACRWGRRIWKRLSSRRPALSTRREPDQRPPSTSATESVPPISWARRPLSP